LTWALGWNIIINEESVVMAQGTMPDAPLPMECHLAILAESAIVGCLLTGNKFADRGIAHRKRETREGADETEHAAKESARSHNFFRA
jgi:hypothetical protein